MTLAFLGRQRSVGAVCLGAARERVCGARGGDGQAGLPAGRPHPAGQAGADTAGRGDEDHQGLGRATSVV